MVDLHKGPQDLTDQEWLQVTGEYIFGTKGWQPKLARELGLSQQFINAAFRARTSLTAEHRAQLAALCSEWLNDLARRKRQIELMEKYWRETAEANYRPPNIKRGGT